MRVHIIANPASGGGRGAAMAEAFRRELDARGEDVVLTVTKRAGDGESVAAHSDAECLVSVGGDGTANEVLNGLDGRDVSLAILPMGTANVVARELGLNAKPSRLADLIAHQTVRRVDVGVVNGRRFLLGAGAGLDAAVTKRVHEASSGGGGYARWIAPAIRTVLQFNHAPIRVTVDGETITETSEYVVIGNCRFSAGVFPVTRRASVTDGKLDVCAMGRLSIPKIAWLGAAVWMPRFPERRDVVYRQGKLIELEAASELAVPLQVDGDPAGFLPARCTVEPCAVSIIAPS